MIPLVIGLSGHAGVGKDTVCQKLIHYLAPRTQAQRVALADPLKEEIRNFIIKNFNIDILNCRLEEKSLVRPLLVAYGKVKRIQTEGKYWTNLADSQIIGNKIKQNISIITDIRYSEYNEDELYWCKIKHGAPLIYIEREEVGPANEDEAYNNKKLKKEADYILKWFSSRNYKNSPILKNEILKLIEWLKKYE